MNTTGHTPTIEKRFMDYESLQKAHLDHLKTFEMPDISKMTQERRQASDDLKSALNTFLNETGNNSKENISVLTRYEKRLGAILKVDDTIALEIKNHKDRLRTSLNQLKHGKKAMQGYKPLNLSKGRPRVLSINR